MEYKKKNKTRTGTTTHSSIWRRVSTILRHKAAAKLALLSTLFLTIILINVASALAYYQSHNLSEIRNIDKNLDMGGYDIAANSLNITGLGSGCNLDTTTDGRIICGNDNFNSGWDLYVEGVSEDRISEYENLDFNGGSGISISYDGADDMTITNTGDLSTSNELQTISTSGSTPNVQIDLSDGGGSVTCQQLTGSSTLCDGSDATGMNSWQLYEDGINRDTITNGEAVGFDSGSGISVGWDGSRDIIITNTGDTTPDTIADDGTITLGTETTGNYAGSSSEGGPALSGDSATGFFNTGSISTTYTDAKCTSSTCADSDASASNEIQTLGTSGNTITLTNGGSITAPYATEAGSGDSATGFFNTGSISTTYTDAKCTSSTCADSVSSCAQVNSCETDPQVGSVVNTYVCYGTGTQVTCADSGITFDTTNNDLEVAGDLIAGSSNGVINAGGARSSLANVIGDSGTPANGFATGDEDLYIEDVLEVDGEIIADGAFARICSTSGCSGSYAATNGELYVQYEIESGDDVYAGNQVVADQDIFVGYGSSTDDDHIYFDGGSTEYIRWDNSLTRFYISDSLYVGGTLSKSSGSFIIDHPLDPLNKKLQHSFVESPEMMNIYKGNNITDVFEDHFAREIKMPDWFIALNGNATEDYSFSITPLNSFCGEYYIDNTKIASDGRFTVHTEKECNFSWVVYAVRHDRYAEEHRIQVEVEKEDDEKGNYTFPELWE